jgi:SRSO17 transposase
VDLHDADGTDDRFRAYAADLASVLGHADRVGPFEDDCVGLISAEGRKSVEPLAAVTAPERTAAQHQSLLHLVAQAPWSDAAVLRRVRERVLPSVCREEPIQAWIIDDTGYPKKGRHSVGVARQYCGQVGKQENCQIAVRLSAATHQASLPVAYRLYLPKDWADDPARRSKAGVPGDVTFQTKPEIALQQMRQARADGVPPGVALADPAYGNDSKFRAGITELEMPYAVGIMPSTMVWRPGEAPLPPAPRSGRGRRATRLRRDKTHLPVSVKALASELAADAWQQIAPAFAGAGLAGGLQYSPDLALCPPARAPGARRGQAEQASGRRVAADRVAGGRGRTGPLLALHTASRHLVRVPGRSDQAALADRARLSRTEAGGRA